MTPDKVADRIAGAIVDLAYSKQKDPKVAVEVLIGHGKATIINETSCPIKTSEVRQIVKRIAPEISKVEYREVAQDSHLADNQKGAIRCGDNGIFKGVPITQEQRELTAYVRYIYNFFESDGKYIIDENFPKKTIIACQSNATHKDRRLFDYGYFDVDLNPLGEWTGGCNVDSGATNRKLGSDMGDSITGGGLHGKDLSKGDVSINIYAFLKAQVEHETQYIKCAIGDEYVDGHKYSEIVEIARAYINYIGGFEKLAEWGLIR